MKSKATICAILLAGCSDGLFDKDSPTKENGYSGARLSIDYGLETDVVGFHFEVERVACTVDEEFERFFYEENVALDDILFPGRIEFLEGAPFDANSMHQGADFFVALDAGCFEVTAAPASEISVDAWTPSLDCSTAESGGLEVIDGYTTEVTLISQCEGELVGALDTLVLLNKPPVVIPNIENKFNNQCEPVEICAEAWDPNDDPIEITLENLSPVDFYSVESSDMELVDYEDGHRVWQQCFTIVTEDIADYQVEVRAYDVAYDEHGAEIRIEDLIGQDSHGWIQLPIHTGWTRSDACIAEDGTLVPDASLIDDDPDDDGLCDDGTSVCVRISDEDMYCSGDYAMDEDLASLICDGTDLREELVYPECDES